MGGNHICNAGISFVDNVIEKKCKYCFVDFFSTSLIFPLTMHEMNAYLDTIVYKFTMSKCKLIFLFLPNGNHEKRIVFYQFVKKYLDSKNLYYIDVNNYLKHSSELCRDEVHTTNEGSIKYAEIICEKFQEDKHMIQLPTDIVKTKYCDIKHINVNKIFNKNVNIDGNGVIIAAYLTIGPKSGIVEINAEKYSIWDIYCHYERKSFALNNIIMEGTTTINILQDDPDYSTCRRNITESNIEKELNIIDIYYLGDIMSVTGN